MQRYVVLDKVVGETPLEALERFRAAEGIAKDIPLTYEGRLDPMASGKLLILIGEECKRQEDYRVLDKEYQFQVLLGVGTDTHDVLGIINDTKHVSYMATNYKRVIDLKELQAVAKDLAGIHTLSYPHYSSKTVNGKPLHTWALEGRINEITIPTKTVRIYSLQATDLVRRSGQEIYDSVSEKIERVTLVTETHKSLGNDFRRSDVRAAWSCWQRQHKNTLFSIGSFTCIASSGTYMRSLAHKLAHGLNTPGLAYSIHRSKIGNYQPLPWGFGFWRTRL